MVGLIGKLFGKFGGGKLLCGVKRMYVDSLACVRVKGGECFRIDSGVKLLYHVPVAFQFTY